MNIPQPWVLSMDRTEWSLGLTRLNILLLEPSIPFRIRIRESEKISDGCKKLRTSVVFAHLKIGESQVLSGRRWVWGRSVYISTMRLEDGELLVVIGSD